MSEKSQRTPNTNSRVRNTNSRGRLVKTSFNAPRFPLNFLRRPSFPFSRRRTMAGRYANTGFRHNAPTVYRPGCPPSLGNSYVWRNPRLNPPTAISSSFVHRPPFYTPRYKFDNGNNIYSSTVNTSQVSNELNEQNCEPGELWVEALAPGGKIYYYNTRTRETTWEKPLNVRIIELNEIKQLPVGQNTEKSEEMRNGNSNQCVQQQSLNNSQVNAYYPQTVSVPNPRVLFPPNVFTPPPNFLGSPTENIQKNVANVRFVMPPPILPISIVPRNLFPNNVINDSNISVTQNLLPSNNIIEFHTNGTQDFFPSSNVGEYNSNIKQNLYLNNINDEYNSNVTQAYFSNNNIGEYNSHVSQDLLPSNNVVEYNSNITQDMLPNNNVDEYDSDDRQDLSPCMCKNIDKYDSNVTTQNLLPKNETVAITNKQQNLLSDNEIIDLHKNTVQNCLSTGKIDDRREKVKRNLFSKTKVIDYSSSDSEEAEAESSITNTEEAKFVKSENENPTSNSQESSISLSSSNFTKITKSTHETTTHHKNEKSADLKSEDIVHTTKSEESTVVETKFKSSLNLLSKDKPVDKSRPVSSTPVPGSYWCVVWTGDEKVFFHDSKSKISVWERPAELLHRKDVDKIVKKSPFSLNLKSLTKETRKNSSDSSEVTKKQKKDESPDLKEKCEVIQTVETIDAENVIQNTSEDEQKTEFEPFSREWKIEMFCEMLSDNNVSVFSTWEKEVHKIVFDSRYLLLHAEERKQVFNDYMKRKSLEEIDKRQKMESQKEAFLTLLTEAGVTFKSIFSDIVDRYSKDGRFTAIEKLELKENMFNQYVSELKQKEQEREKLESESKAAFIELLTENNCFDKEWSEVQNILANDERYKAIGSDSFKENVFKEYVQEKRTTMSLVEKQERTKANLENREKEVKQDRKKKQGKHKYLLAVSNFKTLLEDLINDSSISWESAKNVLKKDPRWNYSRYLGSERSEKLFNEHINAKKKDQFFHLLDECPDITLKTSWLDIRKYVLKDPRCVAVSSCERKCEKEFKDYLNYKRSLAKNEFKELLKETKLITPKSKILLNYSGSDHLHDIEKVLSADNRYLNLECIRNERKRILMSYIDELHTKASQSLLKPREKSKRIKRKK